MARYAEQTWLYQCVVCKDKTELRTSKPALGCLSCGGALEEIAFPDQEKHDDPRAAAKPIGVEEELKPNQMDAAPGYEDISIIRQLALDQAQHGKGKERHAQDLPFDQQPIMQIPRLLSSDSGLLYQAIKKIQESSRMSTEAAIKERLGAINYIAASILYLQNKDDRKDEKK